MSPVLPVLLPLCALPALLLPAVRARAALLLAAVAAATAGAALWLALVPPPQAIGLGGMLRVDATGRLFVAVVGLIFAGISGYALHRVTTTPQLAAGMARLVALALVLLAAVDAVLLANHLVFAWVALELSTLALAPMVVRAGVPSALRASFHYLLFSSVGLGLALLGFVCLGRGMELLPAEPTFCIDELLLLPAQPDVPWARLGVALLLLGLGTKLGLAPMYAWLPETYDEAPPAVTAMLGAVQFNATFVLLLRVVQVFGRDHGTLVQTELVVLGIASMVVTTGSIIATRNLKRLLAYASINHAGVLAIGLGLGQKAAYGVLLYAVSNAFIKAILFLTAGKIKAHYRTKDTTAIRGLIRDLPYSGVFLMLGTFALLGFPPFGSFFGELLILSALIDAGRPFVFAAFCALIAITFVATGRTVFPMIWGEAKEPRTWPRQTLLAASPKLVFLAALIVLGVYVPPAVDALLQDAAAGLGAR